MNGENSQRATVDRQPFNVDDRQLVTQEQSLQCREREITQMLMIDRVKLDMVNQISEIRGFDDDDAVDAGVPEALTPIVNDAVGVADEDAVLLPVHVAVGVPDGETDAAAVPDAVVDADTPTVSDAVAFAVSDAVTLAVDDGDAVDAAVPEALTDGDTPIVSDAVAVAEDVAVKLADGDSVAAAVPEGESLAVSVSDGDAARPTKAKLRHSATASRHARMAWRGGLPRATRLYGAGTLRWGRPRGKGSQKGPARKTMRVIVSHGRRKETAKARVDEDQPDTH